jgi:hypothetical protein
MTETTKRSTRDRPRTVVWAFGFWAASALIGIVGAITVIAGVLTESATVVDGTRPALGVMLVGWEVVRLFLAGGMMIGLTGARSLLTTTAVLALVTLFFHGGYVGPLSWIAAATTVPALILQCLPRSNAYFMWRHQCRLRRRHPEGSFWAEAALTAPGEDPSVSGIKGQSVSVRRGGDA